jgi:hypothetical protein
VFASAKKQKSVPDHNPSKSDVFSLGMTLLEMGTLVSIRKCYDFDNFAMRENEIKTLLKSIGGLYSPLLHNLITKMLAVDEMERPDLDLVYEYVQDLLKNKEINISTSVSIESKCYSEVCENSKAPAIPLVENDKQPGIFPISEESHEDEKSWDYAKQRTTTSQKPNPRYEEILTPLKEEFEMLQRTQQSEQKPPIDMSLFNKLLTDSKQLGNERLKLSAQLSEFKTEEKRRDKSAKKSYLEGIDNKVIEALKFSEEVLNRYKEIPTEKLNNLSAQSKISNRLSTGKRLESFNKENMLGNLSPFDAGSVLESKANLSQNHYYTTNSKILGNRKEDLITFRNNNGSIGSFLSNAPRTVGTNLLGSYANCTSNKMSLVHNTQDFFSEKEDSFYKSLLNAGNPSSPINKNQTLNNSALVLNNILSSSTVNSKRGVEKENSQNFIYNQPLSERFEKDFKKATIQQQTTSGSIKNYYNDNLVLEEKDGGNLFSIHK